MTQGYWVNTPMIGRASMPAMASLPEIVGAYPEFAKKVREVTGEVASRVAARRGGISHDTVIRMWQGDRVSQPIILRFALGYRIDPNPLLEAAGYPTVEGFGFQRQPTPKHDTEERIERIRDPEDDTGEEIRMRMVAAYDKLPLKIQAVITEQTEAMLDAMYELRTDIVGKKADRLKGKPPEE